MDMLEHILQLSTIYHCNMIELQAFKKINNASFDKIIWQVCQLMLNIFFGVNLVHLKVSCSDIVFISIKFNKSKDRRFFIS